MVVQVARNTSFGDGGRVRGILTSGRIGQRDADAIGLVWIVTGGTGQQRMCVYQRKTGGFMIKPVLQCRTIDVAPTRRAMTTRAIISHGAPMNVLMA